MSVAPDNFHAWFPAGLDETTAEEIARRYWLTNPHLAAALAWEAYAATLPATPAVASVNTGTQSVTYNPPSPAGEYGAALARAEWHRSFLGSGHSVPLRTGTEVRGWVPYWELVDDDGYFAPEDYDGELATGFPYPFIDRVRRWP